MATLTWLAGEFKPADWASLVAAIAAAVGVPYIKLQLSTLSKQVKLQHYSDYTKRYQDIALRFPEDVNSVDFVLAGRTDYAHTMRYMRAYFDICFEEWDLSQKKLIDDRFWAVWRSGMVFAFKKKAFQQAWQIIRSDSDFGREFEDFVDRNMASAGV
jgi:hypothetical protein